MKYIVLIVIVVLSLSVGVIVFNKLPTSPASSVTITPSPSISSQSEEHIGTRVMFENTPYRYRFIRIPQGTRIGLIGNFSKQASSQTIIRQNSCRAAINAGYYTADYLPLGTWNNGTVALESPGDRQFINSFVSTDETNRMVAITSEEPMLYGWYFQTGPQLYGEGTAFSLRIKNDESARRSILLKLSDGSTIFLSLFGESSVLSGPLLADVPGVLSAIGQQESWEITDATNLDGGRASFFWDGVRMIDEITSVGSVLCAEAL